MASNGERRAASATIPQPIFTFVTAPKVTDTSHEALTRWLDLRLEYEEVIKSRYKTTGEAVDSVIVNVCNSFDEALLDTLCEIKWERSKEELTNEFLWAWITDTLDNFKNKTLPDIDELFGRELVMSSSKGDVDAQVTDYFHLCNTIIRANGLSGLFKRDDGTKKKCRALIGSLPVNLKKRVKNEIDFRVPDAKSSVPALFHLVCEQALDLDKEARAFKKAKRRNAEEISNDTKSATGYSGRIAKRQKTDNTGPKAEQRAPSSMQRGQRAPQATLSVQKGCWICGGAHKQRECTSVAPTPTTTAKWTIGRHRSRQKD